MDYYHRDEPLQPAACIQAHRDRRRQFARRVRALLLNAPVGRVVTAAHESTDHILYGTHANNKLLCVRNDMNREYRWRQRERQPRRRLRDNESWYIAELLITNTHILVWDFVVVVVVGESGWLEGCRRGRRALNYYYWFIFVCLCWMWLPSHNVSMGDRCRYQFRMTVTLKAPHFMAYH